MGPTIINQYQLVTIQNGKFSYEFVSFEYVVYNFARSSTFLKCFEREKAKRRGVQLPITLSSIVVPGGPPSLQLKKSLKQNHMKNQKREKIILTLHPLTSRATWQTMMCCVLAKCGVTPLAHLFYQSYGKLPCHFFLARRSQPLYGRVIIYRTFLLCPSDAPNFTCNFGVISTVWI